MVIGTACARSAIPPRSLIFVPVGPNYQSAATREWERQSQKKSNQRSKTQGTYPIHGIFHLNQSPENALKRLSPGLAAGMILSCCPFVSNPSRRIDVLLPLIQKLCEKHSVYELYFRKEPSFWNLILTEESINGPHKSSH